MSLVLAGGNKDFIIVAGDQRVMDKEGKVFSENYRKVYKINEDFIVAFAGKIPYCTAILDPVLERMGETMSMFDNINMSEKIEKRVRMAEEELQKTGEKCNFSIIVCGKSVHGQARDVNRNPLFLHIYNYKSDRLHVTKHLLKDFGIRWLALYGSSYDHRKICKQLFERNHAITRREVEKVFHSTILNGAKHDKTVNGNVVFEFIDAK